jgi:anaerobic selenocysteine-containing dehydrogenase
VLPAKVLKDRIGKATISLHPDIAEKLKVKNGGLVKISFDGQSGEALVQIDKTIPAGVVTVPRSMGLAIHEPVPAKVK